MTKKNFVNKPLTLALGASMFVGLFPSAPIATAGPTGGGYYGGGGGNSIADRELARRLERVRQAEEEIAEGDKLYAEKDLEAAIERFGPGLTRPRIVETSS